MENEAVDRRLKRAGSVSEIFFNSLKSRVSDWGEWDDSYNFLSNGNNAFIEENLNEVALTNLDVNAIVFTNTQGKIIGSYAYDFLEKKEYSNFNNLFQGQLNDPNFRSHFMTDGPEQGAILFSGGYSPFYLVSKPVLRSDKSGPSLGYIFMGRFLDQEFVNYLFGDVALYSIDFSRVDNPNLPPDLLEARNKLIVDEKFLIIPHDSQTIYGYSLFKDYNDDPAFVLRIKTDRSIHQSEINVLFYISLLLFVILLFFVLIFLWMINGIFIGRLAKIFEKVEEYKKYPESDVSIVIAGNDELSGLSEEFNSLVKEISSTRNFYKNLLASLPDMVVIVRAGLIVYVNNSFETITGFSEGEAVGQDFLNFVEKDYQELKKQNMKLRSSGVNVLPYFIKMITKKGPLDVRVDSRFFDYQGGQVDLIVLTDVSDSVKSRKKIEEKVDELERLNHVMINRELQMMELKKKIKELEEKSGEK